MNTEQTSKKYFHASCYFDNVMQFDNLMLEHYFSKAISFQTWTFEITFDNTA